MNKITVGLGETINTGNYENIKLYVSIEKEVDSVEEGDAFLAETKALFELANKAIEQQKQGIDEAISEKNSTKPSYVRGF
jgi:hypothetical protein